MSEASSSVKWWLFQFDIDGLLYSPLKPSILPVQYMHILILKRVSLCLWLWLVMSDLLAAKFFLLQTIIIVVFKIPVSVDL